jgi:unsaturated chondroitin disaccharide hydrolase
MQADTQVEPIAKEGLSTSSIGVQQPATLPQGRLNDMAVENALQFSQDQLTRTATELTTSQYPKSTKSDGTWNVLPPTGGVPVLVGWTQGFFPGALWYVYGRTGNYTWRQRADAWTRPLEAQQFNMLSHDMGFKFAPSFVVAYELTGDPYYRRVALSAAGALASRYNPRVGIISTADWNDRWQLPLVTDTMMNLELLLWGATQNQLEEDYQGQEGWRDMALNHALRTLADMVRADGGTYHVVDYDPLTGNIRFKETYQGKGTETTWSRGQAWAMYGYAMVYRYTRDPRMLEAALRVSDYYLRRIPSDRVPNWDFDAPEQQKDSSAAAIAASALLELVTLMNEGDARRQSYWDVALGTLRTLMSTSYLAAGTSSRSILLHGVGDYPHRSEIDVGLIYGDYYFLEALLRYRRLCPLAGWYSKLSFAEAVRTLGTSNTGVRTVEFDVTPLAAPIDGVVGYADSSTNVTAYSHLAMLIRMNPSGIFDVRNGTGYAYKNRVTYAANTRYHIRMVTDLNARRYSVWLRQGSGSEIQLADNYAFRSDAPATNDLGKVAVKSGHYDNEFMVENHSVA